MANPTNINVPPPLAADPTNVNVPVHGTKFPSGITGADFPISIGQGSDLGNGVTDSLVDSWIAPWAGYFRNGNYQSMTATATATFRILNNTQSQAVVAATTPTAGTAAALTFVAAGQQFAEGDEIQLLVTTSGGAGAMKGLQVHLMATQLAGSLTNPV